MTKNTKLSSPNAVELEDLKILFNEENYDLLEMKVSHLFKNIQMYLCSTIFLVFPNLLERSIEKQ